MSESDPLEELISVTLDRASKLAFFEARAKRVVHYLETEPSPDHQYVIKLLRGALYECQRKAGT